MPESRAVEFTSYTVSLDAKRGFDYGEVEPSVAKFLRGQADRLRRYIGKSLIQIGKDLIGAKRYLSHGAFVRWVEEEVGIPARTAQGYMKIAHWADGKAASVARLPPSVLYILSAQTTPAEIVNSILSDLEAGESVTVASLRQKLRAARSEQCIQNFNSENGAVRSSGSRGFSPPLQADWDSSGNDELIEVADILSRNLCWAERNRIYKIMTSPHLLQDASLAQRISIAFARIVTKDVA
jgi:Protein of unknown function (DUF3102)